MKNPPQKPNKPRFFHAIKSGFENGIVIQHSCLKNLNEMMCDNVILRRAQKDWPVKINGMKIEGGWRNFARDNALKVGDFLVFKYEGNLVFKVKVFDGVGCEEQIEPGSEENPTRHQTRNISRGRAFGENSTRNQTSKISQGRGFAEKSTRNISRGTAFENQTPHFHSTLKPYEIKQSRLYVPLPFAKASGLSERTCNVIIKDQRQRSWTILSKWYSVNTYFSQGWKDFVIENDLKEGDNLSFELISGGETPVIQFRGPSDESDIRAKHSAPSVRIEQSFPTSSQGPNLIENSTHADGLCREDQAPCEVKPLPVLTRPNPYFEYKVTASQYPCLSIPIEIARFNGFDKCCCEVILMDASLRTWSAQLEPKATEVIVRQGWAKFLLENGLKAGDKVDLELINKGDKPIIKIPWQFVD